jgi:steroid delta-isomerase-like uncharacterized protein
MMDDATRRLLDDFITAWNRHDAEGLLRLCSDDCIFDAASGSDPWGRRHEGKAALREAFSAVWATWPDASWTDVQHFSEGTRAVSEWTFRGTGRGGEKIEVRGVDLITVRDGLITRKDTFRKGRS